MITPWQYANTSEASHQVALFMWANRAAKYGLVCANNQELWQEIALSLVSYEQYAVPELEWLHAIPNGGLRSKATAGKMKAEGVKSGVFDVFWPLVRFGFPGLYIEMKQPGKINNTSTEQRRFAAHCEEQGYAMYVCDNWRDAADTVQLYWEGRLDDGQG